ncbi:hypothetical protein [Streptomyces daliensis]
MTTAMVLVGAALTAASGCVTVSGEPGASHGASPSTPSPASGPPPKAGTDSERAEKQVVRSPAQEALSGLPEKKPGSGRASSSGGGGQERVTGTEARPAPRPRKPARQEAPRPRERTPVPEPPRIDLPGASLPDHGRPGRPPSRAELCRLGERLGHWETGGRPRVCREPYGD